MPARAIALALALAASACYSYRPLAEITPEQGTPVRVELTAPVDLRLLDVTVNDVTAIRGEVIFWRDTLALSAFQLRTAGGRDIPAIGETVRVPRELLAGAEARRLSGLRTAGLAALFVAATIALELVFAEGGGSGDPGGGAEPK